MEAVQNVFTTDALADHLQRYLAGQYPNAIVSDFAFVTSGWESDVYSFVLQRPSHEPQSLILRLYPGVEAVPKLTREAAGMHRLHEAGYPVPKILLQETEGAALGKPFTLMEKLEGSVLWPVLAAATPPEQNALLDRFGGLAARLHQLDWRPFAGSSQTDPAGLLDKLLDFSQQFYAGFGLTELVSVVDWLDAHRSGITVQPAVVHLDFHANNVFLCKDGHWAVIDWTQIRASDYRADLSWTLMIMGEFGQPQWGRWILQAYTEAAGHPVKDLDYFHVISYAKLLAGTLISLKDGPAAVGMRPDNLQSIRAQVPVLQRVCERLQGITGLSFPQVKAMLDSF